MYKINLVKALTPLRTSLSPVVPNFGSAKQKAHGTVSTSQFEIWIMNKRDANMGKQKGWIH